MTITPDARLEYLEGVASIMLKFKPDKWGKMLSVEEHLAWLMDFLEKPDVLVLVLTLSPAGTIVPCLGFPASLKTKGVYFVKKKPKNISKDNYKDALLYGDLSPTPVDQLIAVVEEVGASGPPPAGVRGRGRGELCPSPAERSPAQRVGAARELGRRAGGRDSPARQLDLRAPPCPRRPSFSRCHEHLRTMLATVPSHGRRRRGPFGDQSLGSPNPEAPRKERETRALVLPRPAWSPRHSRRRGRRGPRGAVGRTSRGPSALAVAALLCGTGARTAASREPKAQGPLGRAQASPPQPRARVRCPAAQSRSPGGCKRRSRRRPGRPPEAARLGLQTAVSWPRPYGASLRVCLSPREGTGRPGEGPPLRPQFRSVTP